jgi:glycolate oxidase FAD binding subunit
MSNTIHPTTSDEVCKIVASETYKKIHPVGNQTKTGLSPHAEEVTRVDMRGITGVVDYQPADFTITVRAGTSVFEVQNCLQEHGQFLPFDPPLVNAGATIGGMVGAGWNGSCRLLWGGMRDFILAVDFVDGLGNLVRGGAAVVKNTAGYDLPKFFIGSYGQFGILTTVCFKVFPKPLSFRTLAISMQDLDAAIHGMSDLQHHPINIVAMDLDNLMLHIRFAGDDAALDATEQRIIKLLHGRPANVLQGADETEFWSAQSHPSLDLEKHTLVKVLCNRSSIALLDKALHSLRVKARYCHAGNSCMVEWPNEADIAKLNEAITRLGHQGVVLLSKRGHRLLGISHGREFWNRVRMGLDPNHKFYAPFLK